LPVSSGDRGFNRNRTTFDQGISILVHGVMDVQRPLKDAMLDFISQSLIGLDRVETK
jgi:hypothetical protein